MANMDLKLWVVHNISASEIDLGEIVLGPDEEITIARNGYQINNDPVIQAHVVAGHLTITLKTQGGGVGEGVGGSTGSPDTTGIIRCAGVTDGTTNPLYIPFAPLTNGGYGLRTQGAGTNSNGAGGFSYGTNLSVVGGAVPDPDSINYPWSLPENGGTDFGITFQEHNGSLCVRVTASAPHPVTRFTFVIIAAFAAS